MKKHTTVTVSDKLLERIGACRSAREGVAFALPAKLSTDPEQNITLANDLIFGCDDPHDLMNWIDWLHAFLTYQCSLETPNTDYYEYHESGVEHGDHKRDGAQAGLSRPALSSRARMRAHGRTRACAQLHVREVRRVPRAGLQFERVQA
jgi:hypothetical protein